MIVTDISKLTNKCSDVSLLDADKIIFDLESELSKHNGIGLAANQIGIDANVCILRVGGRKINLVNPRIIDQRDLCEFYDEGCLSFPNDYITTSRYNEVFIMDALHPFGAVCVGIESVVVQHEIGHLFGDVMHNHSIQIPHGVNLKCWCGSGRKYKRCHLGKKIKGTLE